MVWSSSWVSWTTARLSCTGGWRVLIIKERVPRSTVGCVPDLNGSGLAGGARQADITGGEVLSWKQSNN